MEKIFRLGYQLYPLSLALNYMYLFIEQRFPFFFFHLDQILSCDASTNLLKKTSETRLSSHASVLPTPKPVQSFRPSPPYSPDRIIIALSDSGAATSKPVLGSRKAKKKMAIGDYRKHSQDTSPMWNFRTNRSFNCVISLCQDYKEINHLLKAKAACNHCLELKNTSFSI